MSDRDSFLKAIRANPDDDLPRLVFADWLDEHGDDRWAAVIRDQCAHSFKRVEHTGHGPAGRRPTWVFQRGFVTEFAGSFAEWVKHADAILAESVGLLVRFTDVPAVESNDNIHFGTGQTVHRLRDVPRNRFAFAGKVLPTGAPVTRQHLTDMLRHYWPAVKTWEMPAYPTRHAATATPRAGRRR